MSKQDRPILLPPQIANQNTNSAAYCPLMEPATCDLVKKHQTSNAPGVISIDQGMYSKLLV